MQTKDETSEVAEESSKSKTEEEPPKENMMTKVSPRSAVSMRACICLCFVSVCFQACTYTTPMTHTVIGAVCVCARARVCVCVCVCVRARACLRSYVSSTMHTCAHSQVKAAGVAGLVSYALWEFVFWTVSVPLSIYTYHATTGEWPSFDNPESTAKVSNNPICWLG